MTHKNTPSSNSATRSTATAGRRLVLVTGLMVFAVAFCGIFQCPKKEIAVALTEERLLELVTTVSYSSSSLTAPDLHAKVRPYWEAWKVRHGYNNDDDDDNYRLGIFVQNAASVAVHNAAYHRKWTLYAQTVMASPFAHLTASEFAATHLMESQNCSATTIASAASTSSLRQVFDLPARDDLPTAIDWRTRGILTPVKNQKHCGSCWTFSTTGTLEAHTCLHHHANNKARHDGPLDCPTWTGLAEQQLLDCAWAYDNHGCNGGLPSHAFEYLKHAGGMATEEDYPYKAVDSHECHIPGDNDDRHRAHVAAVYNISNRDEDDLVAAVAHMGPVSIGTSKAIAPTIISMTSLNRY